MLRSTVDLYLIYYMYIQSMYWDKNNYCFLFVTVVFSYEVRDVCPGISKTMCPVQYDSTTKEHIQLIPKYVPVGHEIQNLQGHIRENVKKFYCAKPGENIILFCHVIAHVELK